MFIFRKVISLNLSRKQYILLNISLNRHASSYKYLDDAKASMTRDKDKIFLHDKFNWFTFGKILNLSKALSVNIKKSANKSDLNSAKVGVYCTNTYSYLISILAIWLANGVPFCLSKLYPPKFIEYYLNDSECNLIINSQDRMSMNTVMSHEFDYLLEKKKISNYKLVENDFYKLDSSNKNSNAAKDYADLIDSLCVDEKNREAFLLYTSGTSGPPKGVSITFENFFSSIETIVDSYMWTSDDFILNPLPLNHYSGLVYCLMTPFFMGAQVDLLPKFNADVVWSKLLDQNSKLNMMIAVPTIYSQLVMAYESNSNSLKTTYNKDLLQDILKVKMRLIGSGSAPLSLKTYNDWLALTNYRIVERYGMSEIGMALTNPLIENSESLIANSKTKRLAGYVGKPYGKVRVRIVDLTSCQVLVESNWKDDKFHENCGEEIFGELQIKGPNVFKEYYKQPEQTKQSFTEDGWFKTGDTAEYVKDLGIYKIVGRTSVDVIKSGGYKISALDVEKVLHGYDAVEDVAVMGLSDSVWGQKVFALLVLKPQYLSRFCQEEFLNWCKNNLPKYQIPTIVRVIESMPRNQLGKVNKKELIQIYEKEIN